jgi:protein TonB
MKISKPGYKGKNQSTISTSKRDYKKDINIKWNSGLFVQIGMIVGLLLAIWVVESNWGLSADERITAYEFTLEEPPLDYFVVEEIKPIIKPKKEQKTELKKKFSDPSKGITAVGNHTKKKETVFIPAGGEESKSKNPTPKKTVKRNVLNVEFVPIYPGCENLSTNKEKVTCMSSKIGSYISRKFKVEKFIEKDLYGVQRIDVQFKIDVIGNVTDIRAKASDKDLEKEAIRVLMGIPKMIPGKQGDTYVDVTYSMPILLKIDY